MHNYNEQMLDPVKEYARWVAIGLTILSFILCILSYKWRGISHSFLYLECTIRIVGTFVPNVYNEAHTSMDMSIWNAIIFFNLWTYSMKQIVYNTSQCAFSIFFMIHVVYEKPLAFQ